ncbi:peptidylprolyl isomerase [Xylella taiwanensis]|uniref:Periplasmic chaperone PpiD n=1 Tax=Xylella taiwanensis TaxID=1444770 RepID=Z9JL02_9GAMM|nr:peptidylprolyl isomerase [Xylella taiwanensis]AXI82994.1 peptidylprolyl isomerase [Xylella taiwanensis]EWS78447.1 peptidylprolyl isomerase [Xylella taiwanensis]MCD8458423.1 peptidylprolyl isomerase [Xylella taiwanensis]MCD8460560.1 peptidylprolyl isomerase [Xylella taiwanensis]MCD8465064.1 peptidylprolyl isomerase [Xylella taiwanensis]
MLQKLREKTSGWIATAIIGLLVIPFLFVIDVRYIGGGGKDKVAQVKVSPTWWKSAPALWPISLLWQHQEISKQEFQSRFDQARMQQRAQQGEGFDAREFETLDNKLKLLDQLIEEHVMRLVAEDAGVVINDEAVRDIIANDQRFQIKGKFNQDRYRMVLAQGPTMRTPQMYESYVRSMMQLSMIPSAIFDSGFVPNTESERILTLLGQTRNVDLVTLPVLNPDTAEVSDTQIKEWYDAHRNDFHQPETLSFEYVDLDAANLPAPTPAEVVLRKRYAALQRAGVQNEQRKAAHILITTSADPASQKVAKAKAAKLAEEARKPGADFAALARINSQDPGSKDAGGDLGWVERGMMVKPFEDALFAMKVGEVVGPIETEFGYHVIKLEDIKAAKRLPFEAVRDQLAAEQTKEDIEKAFNDVTGKLMDLLVKNPNDLSSAAAQLGLPLRKLGPVSRRNAIGIAADSAVQRVLFSEDFIQEGRVSDPIQIKPNHSVVLRVIARIPEQQLPLDKVRERVIAAVRADRVDKDGASAADVLVARLQKGESLQGLAKTEKLQITPFNGLQRTAPVPTLTANRAIFSALSPVAGKPTVGKVRLDDGRYAVFMITKVIPGDLTQLPEEQKAMLRQQLGQIEGTLAVHAYVDMMRKRFKVTIDESQL